MTHFISLQQYGLEYRVFEGRHRAGERESVVPSHEAVWCLRSWLEDDLARGALTTLTSGGLAPDTTHGPDERLEHALRVGQITVVRYRPPDLAVALLNAERPASSPPAPAPTSEPTHDITITVTDEDGEPMRGVRYELKLPDGYTARGRTSDQGVIYADGLLAGQCELSFPGLDAGAWRTA